MSTATKYYNGTTDIGTYFCDLTNDQTVKGTKTFETTPVVGTKASDNSSTSAASTAYVKNQAYATLASPTFTGTVLLPAPTANTKQAATTEFVKSAVDALSISSYAPTASPTFTGIVTVNAGIEIYDAANALIDFKNTSTSDYDARIVCNATGTLNIWATKINLGSTTVTATAPTNGNSTQVATTAWVTSQIPAIPDAPDLSTYAKTTALASYAPLASPTFTGRTSMPGGSNADWPFQIGFWRIHENPSDHHLVFRYGTSPGAVHMSADGKAVYANDYAD